MFFFSSNKIFLQCKTPKKLLDSLGFDWDGKELKRSIKHIPAYMRDDDNEESEEREDHIIEGQQQADDVDDPVMYNELEM